MDELVATAGAGTRMPIALRRHDVLSQLLYSPIPRSLTAPLLRVARTLPGVTVATTRDALARRGTRVSTSAGRLRHDLIWAHDGSFLGTRTLGGETEDWSAVVERAVVSEIGRRP
jgi:hypothetical protein